MRRIFGIVVLAVVLFSAHLVVAQQTNPYIAGSTGVTLQVFPNQPHASNPINLTGDTVTLTVVGPTPATTRVSLPMLVATGGAYAYRVTQSSDFPTAGSYNCQLVVVSGGLSIPSVAFVFKADGAL